MLFHDREDAGRRLVPLLEAFKESKESVVLGLARGGVVVAYQVAKGLKVALDVVVIRKIGAPGNEELALGAVSDSGEAVFNENLIGTLGVSSDYLHRGAAREQRVAQERARLYRGEVPFPSLKGKTAILVDDGLATGASMRAAISAVRAAKAKKVVLALPVAAPDSLKLLEKEVDECYCLSTPSFFQAVGFFYKLFPQVTDQEIVKLLSHSLSFCKTAS
jgi:putative phosphoribosyl transferase